ncbi:uncharacterized protein LOC118191605 isoform X2 [Stegodyphus dumicola]|uniref:uncharacterized protein LOC118191605 isoform X2 n=1 Tax=Stegodyphus dumicola TaxID=202533 RepID=UPI0015AC7DD0|nr:uncharacterized protein LOC118191605 isoform X2 [Stegodyphus dumicola]
MYDGTPCQYDSQIYCLGVKEDDVFNMCNPQCPMACSKVQFEYVATDAEPLRQESSLYERMQVRKIFKSHEEMSKNMACMRLHYGSTETRTLAHHPKYEVMFLLLFCLLLQHGIIIRILIIFDNVFKIFNNI